MSEAHALSSARSARGARPLRVGQLGHDVRTAALDLSLHLLRRKIQFDVPVGRGNLVHLVQSDDQSHVARPVGRRRRVVSASVGLRRGFEVEEQSSQSVEPPAGRGRVGDDVAAPEQDGVAEDFGERIEHIVESALEIIRTAKASARSTADPGRAFRRSAAGPPD